MVVLTAMLRRQVPDEEETNRQNHPEAAPSFCTDHKYYKTGPASVDLLNRFQDPHVQLCRQDKLSARRDEGASMVVS